jgi:hypothetical protein
MQDGCDVPHPEDCAFGRHQLVAAVGNLAAELTARQDGRVCERQRIAQPDRTVKPALAEDEGRLDGKT